MAPDRWVKLHVPPVFRETLPLLARDGGWKLRGNESVVLDENYTKIPPRLITLRLLLGIDEQAGPGWTHLPSWGGSDRGLDRALIESNLGVLRDAADMTGFWSAWQLTVTAGRQDDLRPQLTDFHHHVIEQGSRSSLWLADVNETVTRRFTLLRAFFAAAHAPELLERGEAFEGFISARGLTNGVGFGIDALMSIFCTWTAPWLMGISSSRRASVFLTLCGAPWDGIHARSPGEMLQLFRTGTMVQISPASTPRPAIGPEKAEAVLHWWVQQCNELLFLLLDPSRYQDPDGFYDPAAHLTTILSVDRLISSVLWSLTNDPRGPYPRRLALFDVLEILHGLRQGSWSHLCDYERQEADLANLRSRMPADVADVLMARCERAIVALKGVRDGFFPERLSDAGVQVPNEKGGVRHLPTPEAVAAYLRVVRNATHSFGAATSDPKGIALLAGHNGEIPEGVSDLAALHFMQILADPLRLFREDWYAAKRAARQG